MFWRLLVAPRIQPVGDAGQDTDQFLMAKLCRMVAVPVPVMLDT
jgi:hypothetical protein